MTMTRSEIAGKRFGLIADTHDALVKWPEVLERIRAALGSVDAIIHCGDLTTIRALKDLSGIAPVRAVRSAADPAPEPPELIDGPLILTSGQMKIGVVNSLSAEPAGANPGEDLRFTRPNGAEVSSVVFGERVDVCVFGGTHRSALVMSAGTMFVNPGSPSLAEKKSVAVLTLDSGAAAIELIPIP